MPPSNMAAVLVAKGEPLQLQESTYTLPRDDELVVKNMAVAINPYDYIIQDVANIVVSWVKLPFVIGTDVAGEVVEVGKNVKRFRMGDRVVGHAIGLDKSVNRSCEGGFQQYVVLRAHMTASIPGHMSYETACVIPLGLSTAACGIFQKDFLALPFPTSSPSPSGKTLLVWGGSTSVGCNAIQLARAAGYEVIATASPHNHDLLKRLGAAEVFDYHSETVVPDIISAFRDRVAGGAISIGYGSFRKCVEILSKCKGNRFVAKASVDLPPWPKSTLELPPFLFSVIGSIVSDQVRSTIKGVKAKMINGSELVANEVGKATYEDYLGQALEQKTFIPAPESRVVGKGLESVQDAIEIARKGVSAQKLVVSL